MRFNKKLAVIAVGAAAALSGVFAAPADAQLRIPPKFNNYVQCAGPALYTDFVDPDGPDAKLTVTIVAIKVGKIPVVKKMETVTDSYHGTFFFIDRAKAGMLDVTYYALIAKDQDGLKSKPVIVSADCNGTD